nr:ribonuclease H-like domain-containing protein [Tanacetum cinerariifolium]
ESIPDKSRKGVGFVSYNVVPPPPIELFLPPKLDLSNSGLEEFQQLEFEGYGPKTSNSVSEDISNEVKESPTTPLVKDLVSNDKLEKKTIFPTVTKIEFVRPKQQEKPVRKPINGCSRHMTGNMSYLSDFEEFDGGYVTFRGGAKGGKITGKGTLKTGRLADESQVLLKVPRKNNMYSVDMKNIILKESLTCLVAKATLDESMLWHRRLGTKDKTSGILKSFIIEIENLVDKKVKIIGYHLGKFDGKSDDGFFVRYSLNNKAFRVYNIRTRKVEENLHIRFLENKPIIAGDGPKWLFNIDALTKSMNYVPVVAVTTALLEATHADLFGDETKVDMSNISTTYLVPSTPNTRINKDHSLDHVIGDVAV